MVATGTVHLDRDFGAGYKYAVIIEDGIRRMYVNGESIFYYITVMNENYEHPEMPVGAEADIIKGMYLLKKGAVSDGKQPTPRVQLLGSGTIFREVIAAAEKRFVEERELTVMLLVDVSASQDFGSGRRSKLEAAVELSALLAMSAVENGDKVVEFKKLDGGKQDEETPPNE